MSRIGKIPIPIPAGVKVSLDGGSLTAEGKAGKVVQPIHAVMKVAVDEAARTIRVERPSNAKVHKALHGLTRALLANAVKGAASGFERKLIIEGRGYDAKLKGKQLELNVGFCNPVVLPVPDGISIELPSASIVTVKGADRQRVGQFAADVRAARPPEPYKGKGIRYQDEVVRRKAGKKFAGAE